MAEAATAVPVETEAQKAKKIQWDKLDVPIEHLGRAITLPGDPGKMPIDKAIEALKRRLDTDNQMVKVHELIDAYPLDALVAFVKAMTKLYGWASPVSTPSFFGPQPPHILSVKTGHRDEDVVQCPFGAFKLPGVDERINVTMAGSSKGDGSQALVIYGEIKQKDKHMVLELATETRRIVREQSIYKSKAIQLAVNDEGVLDISNPPVFMDTSKVSESDLIFNEHTTNQIDTNILVPIKKTAECRKHKIPLKRGVLLEGPFGTGKTLVAAMTAKVAEENGWTYILLDRVQGLNTALQFANRYAPAIVFAEDIDRIASERDDATYDLINSNDGVISKRTEIMVILTSNHADRLNPVILRPGRLDAVISLRAPDAETVTKLIRFYAGKLISANIDLSSSSKELEGQIPASIRECVERAKLGMIGRGDNKLSDSDILISGQTMKNHLALLNKDDNKKTDADKLAESLRNVVRNGSDKTLEKIQEQVDDIHSNVC